MNQIEEQRVIEALRAITGGLTVTDHDIIDASARMQRNLKAPAPRRNRALLAVAAAAALIVGIASFQAITGDEESTPSPAGTPTPADTLESSLQADAYTYTVTDEEFTAGTRPTAQDLAGVWLLRAPFAGSLVVNGDLDWSHASVHKGFVASSTLDGRTWTRNLDGGHCTNGLRLPWTASIAGDGSLHLLFAGATNVCTPADNREVWDRLTPGPSPVMEYLRETSGDIDWAPPTGSELPGLYVHTETGHVLDVAMNGRYQYFDSVTDQEFTPSDQGALELGAEAGTFAGSCDGGSFSASYEVGRTEAVRDYLAAQNVVRIADSGGACSLGAGGVWLKLA